MFISSAVPPVWSACPRVNGRVKTCFTCFLCHRPPPRSGALVPAAARLGGGVGHGRAAPAVLGVHVGPAVEEEGHHLDKNYNN